MKHFLCCLAVLLMLLPSGLCIAEATADSMPEVTETRLDQGTVSEDISHLLDIARGELGYTEGPNNATKYGEWSGDPNAAWCAEFVCWCVYQTDEQYGTELLENVYPRWGGQNVGKNWFIRQGRFVFRKGNCPEWGYQWLKGSDHYLTKNEYIPHPGDLLFFSYNEEGDTEHVALVEYCAMNGDGQIVIHVIEGNNPDRVQRNSYLLDNSQVLGFGIPEDRVDTVMRSGNSGVKVTRLQEMLSDLGLLDAVNITGSFGTHTKQAIVDFQLNQLRRESATGIVDRECYQAIECLWEEMIFNDPSTWAVED